jgi:glycosyltransferase involved in cell wall biosynthesis
MRHSTSLPRVSVVMPAFNEAADVMAASMDSLVVQTMGHFECIVIDESTQPEAAAACNALCKRDPRFHYIRPSTRIGLAGSLNLGIAMARASLIARFDSDDICLPYRFEHQVAFLDAHPEVGVLGGCLEIFSPEIGTIAIRHYPTDPTIIARRFQTTTAIAHPTVMMRKSILERFGGYDPSFRFAEDLDLWLRLLNHDVRFANLSEVLVRYRQQSTARDSKHWKFNLRARLGNFSHRHLPYRIAGVMAIAAWRLIPRTLQEHVFRKLLLS